MTQPNPSSGWRERQSMFKKLGFVANDLLATVPTTECKQCHNQTLGCHYEGCTELDKPTLPQLPEKECEHLEITGMTDGKREYGRVCNVCGEKLPDKPTPPQLPEIEKLSIDMDDKNKVVMFKIGIKVGELVDRLNILSKRV